MGSKRDREPPRWKIKARFGTIRKRLMLIPCELNWLRAKDKEAEARRGRDKQRNRCVGRAVVERLVWRRALVTWLRLLLRNELAQRDRGLFGLEQDTPLIPEYELPRRSGGDALSAPILRTDGMSPKERKRRIAQLEQEQRDLEQELRDLEAKDKNHGEPMDPKTQRLDALGAVLLRCAARRESVTRWLRRLLDTYLKAKRERSLFQLNASGPLVPEEDAPTVVIGHRSAKNTTSGRVRVLFGFAASGPPGRPRK